MSIYTDLTGQFIDESGKTRMLIYSSGLSLMTSPLPSLDVARIQIDNADQVDTDLDNAIEFINRLNFKITSQHISIPGKLKGLWLEPSEDSKYYNTIFYGYIPLIESVILEDIEITASTTTIPLYFPTVGTSKLKLYRDHRRIAYYIEQYMLFDYARSPDSFDFENPDTKFVIIDNHTYDVGSLNNTYIPDTHIMYFDGKLICTSHKMIDNLIGFLKVKLLNNKKGILSLANQVVIKGYYKNITDFKQENNQIIFMDLDSLTKWTNKQTAGNMSSDTFVSDKFIDSINEPYFYMNSDMLNGEMVIIQNVRDGHLQTSTKLGRRWHRDNVNEGWGASFKDEDIVDYIVYKEDKSFKQIGKSKNINVYVLKYASGNYAAILHLNPNK